MLGERLVSETVNCSFSFCCQLPSTVDLVKRTSAQGFIASRLHSFLICLLTFYSYTEQLIGREYQQVKQNC